MPRPGSRLIPAGFAAHHQRPVLDTLTAVCTLTRGGGTPTFNPTTGTTSYSGGTVIGTGIACRVQDQLLRRVQMVEFGGQQVTIGRIRITLPLAQDVATDDRLLITASDTPNLVGKAFRVMQIELSSIAWQQELTCEINLG